MRRKVSYVDPSLFRMIEGLRAFPRAMTKQERKHPRLTTLHDRVAGHCRAAYLASERRLPFNQAGFHHYPELVDKS